MDAVSQQALVETRAPHRRIHGFFACAHFAPTLRHRQRSIHHIPTRMYGEMRHKVTEQIGQNAN
jgi:hypothetical protein